MLGDSLTDGRGSTTNGNDRWPDQLLDGSRLRGGNRIAVLNQAAGGNRVLNDGLGPNALARLDRDVLAQSGVAWLVVFEGVNDIGTADRDPGRPAAGRRRPDRAYEQIVVRAHAQGIRVYGATLTPFGGNDGYDDPAGCREAARQAVNRWIRTSGRFDAVIDFDAADPRSPPSRAGCAGLRHRRPPAPQPRRPAVLAAAVPRGCSGEAPVLGPELQVRCRP